MMFSMDEPDVKLILDFLSRGKYSTDSEAARGEVVRKSLERQHKTLVDRGRLLPGAVRPAPFFTCGYCKNRTNEPMGKHISHCKRLHETFETAIPTSLGAMLEELIGMEGPDVG